MAAHGARAGNHRRRPNDFPRRSYRQLMVSRKVVIPVKTGV
jgi:hypothetical protein